MKLIDVRTHDELEDKIYIQVRYLVWQHVWSKVWLQSKYQVNCEICNRVMNQVRIEFDITNET